MKILFVNAGVYEPCGIFTIGHFVLIALTIIGIIIGLKKSLNKNKEEIHSIIKYITIIVWILEIIKIIFNVRQNSFKAINTYVPLYYCSILLYAGLLSSFTKGTLKKMGDVSLATGSIIGGIVFLIYPSTSLPIYPVYHFLSIHSFIFHGTMIYLGILLNKTKYVELKKGDIKYFAGLIGLMCIFALVVNNLFDGNLMFISNNFPGTPVEILYKITNGGILYSFIMIMVQMTIPFYICYYFINKAKYFNSKSIITMVLLIQTIIFIIAGINKSYIHMDEAYSLGLASYNKTEIQANEDFYNNWHNKEYYEDYLSVNSDEIGNYKPVYENQKNDVHPPLYYLLLRVAMGLNINNYSKWTGIILNIIIFTFITIFMYLIINILLEGDNRCKEKSAILALISSLTLSSINNAIYIRMYALSTLNIVITTYLHLKLLDKKGNNYKLLILIGIFALLGSLTHYYYLFFLATLFIMFVIKYIKEKEYKELIKYVLTMVFAGIISLVIFPYSIQHMFFGYRGQGVISKLTNISEFLKSIGVYLLIINVYAFNNILFILFILGLSIIIYKLCKKINILENKNKYVKYIAIPTIVYTILVAISSPWLELRYIMPVCNLIFILVIYFISELMKNIVKEKTANKIIVMIFLLLFIMPFLSNQTINFILGKDFRNEKEDSYSSKTEIVEKLKNEINMPVKMFFNFNDSSIDNVLLFLKDFKIEPEVMYSGKQDIVKTIKDNCNLPAIYCFNSNNNRFLDDILLFANINESYIAKDIEYNQENIKRIMENKNTSEEVLIFINDGQKNDDILSVIKDSFKLENITYLKRLNACDVYLVN